jgi:hypothetical protein
MEMTKPYLKCLLLAGLIGTSLISSAQSSKWKFDYIGVEAGAYFPKSQLLKDRFGSTILRVGLTPVMIKRQKDWIPSFELGYIGATGHGDHMAVIPLTIGMQKSFGDPKEQTVPFVRIGAGLAYFDYDLTRDDLSTAKGHKFGAVTALEAGFLSGSRFRASVRYYLMSKQSGVDFSGFLISATFGAFKI